MVLVNRESDKEYDPTLRSGLKNGHEAIWVPSQSPLSNPPVLSKTNLAVSTHLQKNVEVNRKSIQFSFSVLMVDAREQQVVNLEYGSAECKSGMRRIRDIFSKTSIMDATYVWGRISRMP
jgi:hypothetical protein